VRATVRLVPTFDGPIIEILPLPDNHLDREKVARLADLMPLRFRVPLDNVAVLNVDGADIILKHMQAWTKG
jgi:hypothetical protein